MKRILTVLLLLCSGVTAFSQATGNFTIEVDQVHYGMVGATDLNGYITYSVYAEFTDEDDFLSALYGLLQADDQPDDEDIFMYGDGDFFNEELFGGYIVGVISDGVCAGFPEACYDTYWTIGESFTSDPGETNIATTVPAFLATSDPSAELIDDGVIFTLNGQPNGFPGPDLRNKIAQVTTNGTEFTLDFCIQVFTADGTEQFLCPDPQTFFNPCIQNPFDVTPTVTADLLCNGELATVEFDPGGNGPVDCQLFTYTNTDTTIVSTTVDDFIYEGLGEGDYFVVFTDEVGCIDTTDAFGFVEPEVLELTLNQTADNLCFGDAIAEWCPTITGGTIPYNIDLINPDSSVDSFNDGDCFSNLGCIDGQGDYTVNITDDNGCQVSEDISVTCPEEIVIDATTSPILCNGLETGAVEVNITGGTGVLTLDFTDPDFNFTPQEAPIDLTISDLGAGQYTLTITDENNSQETQIFDLIEPDALDVTFTSTDIVCFGECSGVIEFIADGGTGPFELVVTDLDGNVEIPTELCAGEHIATVFDNNDCPFIDTLTITEPPQIVFNLDTTNVSCFGANDGEICISNVTGGTGVVQWQISSPPSEATALGTEPCFSMLPADTYTMNFIDDIGCTIIVDGLIIIEPDELIIDAVGTDVTCFGLDNGMIEVNASGGTGTISLTSPETQELPFTIENLVPGNVNVVITDETGCQDSVVVEINEPLELTVVLNGTTDISCGDDCDGAVDLDISGGTGEIALFLNDVPSVPVGLCAGVYEAIVVDENQCQDTVTFEIEEPDPVEFSLLIEQVTCTGMNDGSAVAVPFGGTGNPANFELTFFPIDADENNLFEGEYTYQAIDSVGCVFDTTFFVTAEIETDLSVTIFTSPVTCWNEADGTATAAVTGGTEPFTFEWNDPDMQTTATAVGLAEEVYSVTVSDGDGCILSFFAEVEPTVGCFFIADALTPNGDGANDEWIIGGLEFFPNSLVQVFNRWGQLLYESKGYSTPWDGTWNGNALPVADYYYVITYDESKEPILGTVTIKY
ncbi:MAG: gliding motility-associated C-terminal domain-containing protein [Flavobacteriales bacterium]|nr:gliding motility-associated C-terminal domain-containing protein [Flavobacteriales bacterium]